jgi:hypothetical protein
MKNAVFWDVALCGSCKNRHFGGTQHLQHQGTVFLRGVHRLLVTAKKVPSSPIFATLMMHALHSTEKLVLTIATWSNIPEEGILYSHCHENLKSYIALTGWAL